MTGQFNASFVIPLHIDRKEKKNFEFEKNRFKIDNGNE